MRDYLRRPEFWLVAVAFAYLVTMLLVVVLHTPLGSDEALYASEVNPHVPSLPFTAPRARGITWLIAPALQITQSTAALRGYLAVLSAVALVVAYWPWLRVVRRPALVPFAALLFAGTWSALFYGADDMPDIWVAFAAVATVGWFMRYGEHRRARDLAGVAIAIIFMTLMRPGDALWVLLPLVIAMVASPRWRAPRVFAAVFGSAVLGVLPWVVEAYVHYGGLLARLHKSSQEQGGLGFHPENVLYTLRSLTGPTLCRPCSVSSTHFANLGTDLYVLWWLAIPALAVVGVMAARREGHLLDLALPAACGASIGGFYLLSLDYAAPRFLLPAYALLALPMAAGVWHVVSRVRMGRLVPAFAIGLVVAELASQLVVLDTQSEQPGVTRVAAARLARYAERPCLLTGLHRTQLAYLAGCNSVSKVSPAQLRRSARVDDVAVLTASSTAPHGFHGWRRVRLPISAGHWYAYLPPRQE